MSDPITSSPSSPAVSIAVIGAGPRAVGVIERIAANLDELWTPGTPLEVHLIDPHPAGPGRIWRFAQSPLLKLNSMAADVTMFTDETSTIEGPVRPGPALVEWAARVSAGEITLPAAGPGGAAGLDDALWREVRALGPASFPTRRLQSLYLRWFFEGALAELGVDVSVREHRARALDVEDTADTRQRVRLDDGSELTADLVLYSLGHTGVTAEPAHARLADFAARHDRYYLPPAFTADADTRPIAAGERVLVRGFGLAAVDLIVLLTEGRGGEFVRSEDGGSLTYVPSGEEPKIVVGSRRGVPYHSKIGSAIVGEAPAPRFLTPAIAAELEAHSESLDFGRDIWPLIAKDMLWGYYRELFTGHADRVSGSWQDFARAYEGIDPRAVILAGPSAGAAEKTGTATGTAADATAGTRASTTAGRTSGHPVPRGTDPAEEARLRAEARALTELIESRVPHEIDRLFLPELDRPLADARFDTAEDLQAAVRAYIRRDLTLRTRPEHSATLGLFLSILTSMFVFAELVASPKWTANSRVSDIHGWWQGYFSFIASGPPAHRLEELLALSEAGIVDFLGGEIWVDTDEVGGVFRAGSANHQRIVTATALVDARLPDTSIARSDSEILLNLLGSGHGIEEIARDPEAPPGNIGGVNTTIQSAATGRLTVRAADRRVVRSSGTPSERRYAIGPYTNSPFVGAFSRPRTNAVAFRENDRVARALLAHAAEIARVRSEVFEPELIGTAAESR
ncbi:adenylate cyclase [Mycetocola tolaasinivorans]|uniref:Adenylate cyclase n=1 Tax=Mycetocola tolaasinivorans TaxID=76635 RepID=A0A3L7A4Y3_9MICO|nr:FAD/NAD(P)-binding protein [Mycetocola tolaasinivorans]RLP74998.1 adenylate cyclase [Mycetocola tolaasinivorans]